MYGSGGGTSCPLYIYFTQGMSRKVVEHHAAFVLEVLILVLLAREYEGGAMS